MSFAVAAHLSLEFMMSKMNSSLRVVFSPFVSLNAVCAFKLKATLVALEMFGIINFPCVQFVSGILCISFHFKCSHEQYAAWSERTTP